MLAVLDRFAEKKLSREPAFHDPFLDGNELIEAAIHAYHAEARKESLSAVLEAVRQRMHEDGHFMIPVMASEDGTAFIGYKFRHMMKVEFLSDNDRLGKVLYALANCPVKPEFCLSYTVSDPEAAKNKLLGKAVTDAKEKASVLTQAAGVTLKDIQSIDYSWGEIDFEYRPMNRMLMASECLAAPMAAGGTSYDMDIEPDDIEVSDTVTVLWEIA